MNCKVFKNDVEAINEFLKGKTNIESVKCIDDNLIAVYWYEPNPRETLVSCEKSKDDR